MYVSYPDGIYNKTKKSVGAKRNFQGSEVHLGGIWIPCKGKKLNILRKRTCFVKCAEFECMNKLEPKFPHWFTIRGYREEGAGNGGGVESETSRYIFAIIFQGGSHSHYGDSCNVINYLNPYIIYNG